MKPQTFVAALIAATLATSAFADADHDYPQSTASATLPSASSASPPTSNATATITQAPQQGKTRAQVVQELIQAQREGLVPSGHADYPPRQATIDRNRALMRAADPTWVSQ
jgi:hypothetical protein